MREAEGLLSRQSVASALFAATILLSAFAAPTAALAESRGSTHQGAGPSSSANAEYGGPTTPLLSDGAEVALPRPLSPSQAVLYRRIFADQHNGKITAAKALIARVRNPLLMSQVLAQLYLGPYHYSTAPELRRWLLKYGGQPNSGRIIALLRQRLPPGETMPVVRISKLPNPSARATGMPVFRPHAPRYRAAEQARELFTQGKYNDALSLADSAVRMSDGKSWLADYIAGLSAWQKGNIKAAGPFFRKAAQAPFASSGERAAGAFWAARTALRLDRPAEYFHWLGRAAQANRSFYGILAARLLGRSSVGDGITATLSEADVESIDALPAGKLAFGLLEAGRPGEASEALLSLWPTIQKNPALGRAAIGVAAHAGLFDVAVAFNRAMPSHTADGAPLPLPALHPTGGFKINPPLLYAVARTESRFNPEAVSRVGARGVMQLMPETAYAMARETGLPADLTNPSINMALGQTYLRDLAGQPGIKRNLLDVLASYNAGPVAVAAWTRAMHDHGDPLIFLESIPNGQTRRFVQQVITDSWIYAEEIGIQPKSLKALAEGRFPRLGAIGDLALAGRQP